MSEILQICGGKRLEGEVNVSGSKNSILPILAATLVIDGEIVLQNVPNITDVYFMISILEKFGLKVLWSPNKTLLVKNSGFKKNELCYSYVNELRASVLFVAGILSRFDSVIFSLPGGDKIGNRPINFHLEFLAKCGFSFETQDCFIRIFRSKPRPKKVTYRFPFPSVGATEQAIIYSSSVNSEFVLENCAIEPEILDLINFLRAAGAQINLTGREIRITGGKLVRDRILFDLPGDRIEFITYVVLGALVGKEVLISGCDVRRVLNVLRKLKAIGVNLKKISPTSIGVKETRGLKNFKITATPYPGFPTDAQPLMAVLGTRALNSSVLLDKVFPTRFAYLQELSKFGIKFQMLKTGCRIFKAQKLSSACVKATDIRAGAALLLASLSAKGDSIIFDAHHLRRGYDSLDLKIRELGGSVYYVDTVLDDIKAV